MIYTRKTKTALKLCFDLHKNQVDKGGMPYVFHPYHLAEQMEDEDTCIVALLHDVLEDTPTTLEDLKQYGFNTQILNALDVITYKPGTKYFDYIENIKNDAIAKKVKLADLYHNMDYTRLDHLSDKDRDRISKYKEAIRILNSEK